MEGETKRGRGTREERERKRKICRKGAARVFVSFMHNTNIAKAQSRTILEYPSTCLFDIHNYTVREEFLFAGDQDRPVQLLL